MDSSEFLLLTEQPEASGTPACSTDLPAAPAAPVPLPARPPGLVVGHAEDPAELAADRRADAALERLAPIGAASEHLRRSPAPGAAPAVGYDGGPVSDEVAAPIERLRGSGRPLPAATRARMEQGFGASFAGVRLHVGAEPARLNRMVSAKAFTVGRDVFFGAGRFDPDSPDGERVLAHELAHTLEPTASVRRKPLDLAATPAATDGDLAADDGDWLKLHTATLEYSLLTEDMYDARAAKLAELDRLSLAWMVQAKEWGRTNPNPSPQHQKRHTDRVDALRNLRSLVAVEQRELAAAGVRPNEHTQRIQAPRFKGDYLLEQVMAGTASLKVGDTGLYVTKVQQALADLKWLNGRKVTGTFGPSTQSALNRYQKKVGLPETGVVNSATMAKLDARFATHKTEAHRAKQLAAPIRTSPGEYPIGSAPAELLAGTRTLSEDDAAAARDAVKTKQLAGPGGVQPTFVPDLPAGNYETRLLKIVNDAVLYQYEMYGKDKALKRDDTDLVGWPHIEKVAARSKAATDAVFGRFAIGPVLKKDAGIHDGWDTKVSVFTKGKVIKDGRAKFRVDKLLAGDADVKALDREHGAIQSRPAEAAIVDRVRTKILTDHYDALLETDKGWPGFAAAGQINIQRFKADDDGANRTEMWNLFHAVIHEYLHTLEHSVHKDYHSKLGPQEGAMSLREGVVDYLTHTVLETVKYNKALRREVEGEFYEEGVEHPIPKYTGYGERAQAEKLAGIVGARNVMAAFFLGDVSKIGKAP